MSNFERIRITTGNDILEAIKDGVNIALEDAKGWTTEEAQMRVENLFRHSIVYVNEMEITRRANTVAFIFSDHLESTGDGIYYTGISRVVVDLATKEILRASRHSEIC